MEFDIVWLGKKYIVTPNIDVESDAICTLNAVAQTVLTGMNQILTTEGIFEFSSDCHWGLSYLSRRLLLELWMEQNNIQLCTVLAANKRLVATYNSQVDRWVRTLRQSWLTVVQRSVHINFNWSTGFGLIRSAQEHRLGHWDLGRRISTTSAFEQEVWSNSQSYLFVSFRTSSSTLV